MKKIRSVRVDDDIWKKAQDSGINASKLIEETLKSKLGTKKSKIIDDVHHCFLCLKKYNDDDLSIVDLMNNKEEKIVVFRIGCVYCLEKLKYASEEEAGKWAEELKEESDYFVKTGKKRDKRALAFWKVFIRESLIGEKFKPPLQPLSFDNVIWIIEKDKEESNLLNSKSNKGIYITKFEDDE